MDRRLNNIIDKNNDGNTVMLRNAGANVNGLSRSITFLLNNNDIKTIKLIPHTDCGAMKVVYNALKGKIKPSSSIYESLVKQFEGKEFSTIEELEMINEGLQYENLAKIARGISIEKQFIDLHKYSFDDTGEHIAVFTYSSTKKYEEMCKSAGIEMNSAYFIEANSIEEGSSDIEIAVRYLGINHVLFLASDPSEYRKVYAEMKRTALKDFMAGVKIEFAKI